MTFAIDPQLILQSWSFFISNTIQWLVGYFLTIGLRAVYKNYRYREKSLVKVLGFVLFYSFISSILFFAAAHIIFISFDFSKAEEYLKIILSYKFIAERLSRIFPLMATWSLLYFGIKFWLDWNKEKDRAEKAYLMAQSAQLQMLRYQVNPHFLFNSFSSLRALIRSDKDKAEKMITLLSEFYRYTLSTKNNSEVSLLEEIEAIEYYFNIEKIRFGNKIEFTINIDPLAEEYPIPSFLLHPLVENAIKYGMKTSEIPLKISVDAEVKDSYLNICISNSGNWYKHEKNNTIQGTGTGLTNIKNRLEYSFPGNYKFDIIKGNGMVSILIKLHKELK